MADVKGEILARMRDEVGAIDKDAAEAIAQLAIDEAIAGYRRALEIDPDLVVPDDSLSIDAGALKPWGEGVSEKEGFGSGFRKQILRRRLSR